MKKLVMMLTLMMVAGVAVAEHKNDNRGTRQLPKGYHDGSNHNRTGNTNQLPFLNGDGWNLSVCINGINLLGEACQGDTWGNWNQPRQLKATGKDAIDVIRNGKILTSGVDGQGWTTFIVTYQGTYAPAKGKTFSCKVSPDARQFVCFSWAPGKYNDQYRRNN